MSTRLSDRLAVCSWSLRPESPAELAQHLNTIGIRRTQLAIDPIRLGGAWVDGFRKLEDLGISIASGMFGAVGEDYTTLDTIRKTGGIVPDETWPQTFDNFRRMAPMVSHAGIKHITFHAGFLPHDPTDPTYAILANRLEKVADLFADHGLTCCLETGQEDAESLRSFLQTLDRPNVGVNFDPANLILYAKGDPIEGLKTLLPFVSSAHIKDAVRTRVPGTWGEEVVVGTGEVDWPAFFSILSDGGFTGTLAIEREAGDARVADIKTALEFVRRIIQ
jgi:L-ribulose-5-phosphate 3-epimerase